jgi:hypothetical protein
MNKAADMIKKHIILEQTLDLFLQLTFFVLSMAATSSFQSYNFYKFGT